MACAHALLGRGAPVMMLNPEEGNWIFFTRKSQMVQIPLQGSGSPSERSISKPPVCVQKTIPIPQDATRILV